MEATASHEVVPCAEAAASSADICIYGFVYCDVNSHESNKCAHA
jgi:hypothetical protein